MTGLDEDGATADAIRIVVVDDSADLRQMLATLFRASPRFEQVGEAADAEGALQVIADTEPDLVLLDVRMRGGNGTHVLEQLRHAPAPPVIVVLSGYGHVIAPAEILAKGADAHFSKDIDADELLDGLFATYRDTTERGTDRQAPTPADEADRLSATRAVDLLDNAPDELFDTVTQLVAAAFNAAFALVTVSYEDRQWVQSRVGDLRVDVSREVAFFSHAVLDPDEVTVVEDASLDTRFADSPLVTAQSGVRFYAGATVRAPNGQPIGALCVLDTRPRDFSTSQRKLLRGAASQVEAIVATQVERDDAVDESRRVSRMHSELEQRIQERTSYLAVAQHKLKTPLTVVAGWSRALQHWEALSEDERTSGLEAIHRSAGELRAHIDDLLDEARAQLLEETIELESIEVSGFVARMIGELRIDASTHPIDVSIEPDLRVLADRAAVRQILVHLIDNAVKYSPNGGSITISADQHANNVVFRVSDQGIGLPDDVEIFEPFQRGRAATAVARGTGLGLYIVQSLVGKMSGVVAAVSEADGTTIEVILPSP